MVKNKKGGRAGGLDLVVEDALEAAVLDFAADLPTLPDSISARTVAALTPADMEKTCAAVATRAKGQNSPLLNLEALTWSVLPFEQGQPKERALHLELRGSKQSQALRYAFFSERAVSKPVAIAAGQPRKINRIVVGGGGLMGAGIATSALSVGASVTIIERDGPAADAALDRVYGNLDGALKRGKISAETCRRQKGKLSVAAQYEAAAEHDLAIDAVFEDVAIKKEVFARLEAVMATDAILATNTSYLDPKEIFADVSDQKRCVGLHFFSPAHIMKLLEVVQLPSTSADTLATAFTLAKRLKIMPFFQVSATDSSEIGCYPSIGGPLNTCWRMAPCHQKLTKQCAPLEWRWGLSRSKIWGGCKSVKPTVAVRMLRVQSTNDMSQFRISFVRLVGTASMHTRAGTATWQAIARRKLIPQ